MKLDIVQIRLIYAKILCDKVSVNVNLGKSTNESILLLGEFQFGLHIKY